MDLIEVKQLVKKYGDHLAVDHLDFQMEAGKITVFWGPNGAGKIDDNEYHDRISRRDVGGSDRRWT